MKPERYDALVLPGGRAPEYLRLNERVLEIVRHFAAEGKPIAADLSRAANARGRGRRRRAAMPGLSGREAGTPAGRRDLGRAGARTGQRVCRRQLITAPAWPAHPAWMRAFLKALDAA